MKGTCMKKLISYICIFVLILALAVPVCAEDGVDDFVALLDQMFAEDLGRENYELSSYGRVIIFSVNLKSGNQAAAKARAGDASAIHAFEKVEASAIEQQKTMQDALDSDEPLRLFVYNCRDAEDHTLLLSVVEGEVVYNAAKLSAAPAAAAPAATPKPDTGELTMGQKNAIKKAESYLSFSSFSHKSLIEQLEYEGFDHEDAVFAVDSLAIDWNAQAVKKAQSYLKFTSFSRKGLIEQLEYEGFTHEQAEYAADQVGY